MVITQADYHLEMAVTLAAQRFEWAEGDEISADSLSDIEQRWRAHLHVVAEIPVSEEEEQKASKPEEICVLLARRALGGESSNEREEGWRKACEYLETGAARGDGAFQFLSLFPQPAASERLKELFQKQAPLRGPLLRLWSMQSAAVPLECVRQVLDDVDATADAKAAALDYARGREEAGREIFQPFLSDPALDTSVAAAAFTAALLRGYADAPKQLRELLVQQADDRLYHLAALSGDPLFEPLLQEAAARTPETGLMHLALFGRREGVPTLLAAIENPRTAEVGAKAWTLLAGQRLPRVPRLKLVGQTLEPVGIATPEERALRVPDAGAARAWWAQKRTRWPSDVRYLRGRPMNVAHLAALAESHAGTLGRDFHTLLEMTLKQPLGVSPDTWVASRRACYLPHRQGAGSPQGARRA